MSATETFEDEPLNAAKPAPEAAPAAEAGAPPEPTGYQPEADGGETD